MKRIRRESVCCRAPIETRIRGELPTVGGGQYARVATIDVCSKCGCRTKDYEPPKPALKPVRKNAKKRNPNTRWKIERERAMAKTGGMCTKCPSKADVVHHKIPVCVRPELQYTQSNLEPLCTPCHRKEHPEINAELFTTRLLTTR